MADLRLAHYRITGELGRGGMGIVYRAEDTKLDRTVALKVLPPHALSSDEDRARFYREARAAARLNHAHICHVYQVDEAVLVEEGTEPAPDAEKRPFIAMEYVDGESLADRIARGPLGLDEAVRIATEVAEALAAAHDADIVHRDVKSGNVMLTAKGEAKVLDFGLAKTAASTQLTRQGSTLGTVAYMSPEQARGEAVDRTTDLWALGVVLYEMIAGRLPFAADYEQAALYGILNEDPEPLTAIRTGVPMPIEAITDKLLRKEARLRYQTAGDVVADLRNVATGTTTRRMTAVSAPASQAPANRTTAVWAAVAGLVLGVALAAAWFVSRSGSGSEAAQPVHAQINLPPGVTLEPGLMAPLQLIRPAIALSPNGSRLAIVGSYGATTAIYVRELARNEFRPLQGTEGAYGITFSPDGSRLAFYSGDRLKTVPFDGGAPREVARVSLPYEMVWLPDDRILFANNEDASIDVVDVGGGPVESLRLGVESGDPRTKYGGRPYQRLPNGRILAASEFENYLIDLENSDVERIAASNIHPWYLERGFSVFREGSGLSLARSDPETGLPSGPSVTVLDSLMYRMTPLVAVSSTGTVVAARGPDMTRTVYTWLDADRVEERLPYPVERRGDFRISPDGTRIAGRVHGVEGSDVWIYDIARGTATRLSSEGHNDFVTWAPDGRSVVYRHEVDDVWSILRQSVDGLTAPELIASAAHGPQFLSPDGRYLAVTYYADHGGVDLGYFDLGAPEEILDIASSEQATEVLSRLSHDGTVVAYTSSQTGNYEVYAQPFPPDGRVWSVSVGGGEEPVWSADDRFLFYRYGDRLLRVPVSWDGGVPSFGVPERVYDKPFENVMHYSFDVSPVDGRILLLRSAVEPQPITSLQLLTSTTELLDSR